MRNLEKSGLKPHIKQAFGVSLTVGLILTLFRDFNQFRNIGVAAFQWLHLINFVVPFFVSMFSSTRSLQQIRKSMLFPEQNPNPVMRVSENGHLLYANHAAMIIVEHFKLEVGSIMPQVILNGIASASDEIDIVCQHRTFSVKAVRSGSSDFVVLYATDVTAERVISKLPDQNPNPVFRTTEDGKVLYGNSKSLPIIECLGGSGGYIAPDAFSSLMSHTDNDPDDLIEVACGTRIFGFKVVPLREFKAVSFYGVDLTASKYINKFPDQNPNPVLRVSQEGRLIYSNPAAHLVKKALKAEMGELLEPDLLSKVKTDRPEIFEASAQGRTFSLLAVQVVEFGFINIYGTDITAAKEVEIAEQEIERLLLNILPESVVQRLRKGNEVIADRFEEASILFADVVNFTEISAQLQASALVELLNKIFSIFDQLTDRYGLEKIKTIGDAYMVVGGINLNEVLHTHRIADMALEMLAAISNFADQDGKRFQLRIGIHVGPVVAGVIGTKKYIYDVWGDSVNTASRMESHGVPDKIHVTAKVYEKLQHSYRFESRDIQEVKGKGKMQTYFLTGKKPDSEKNFGNDGN